MSTKPAAPKDFALLYRRAFTVYGPRALWNKRQLEEPSPTDALVVARALRIESAMSCTRLTSRGKHNV